MKKNIVVPGGAGRFGKILKEKKFKNFYFPNKRELNILKPNSIENYLRRKNQKLLFI